MADENKLNDGTRGSIGMLLNEERGTIVACGIEVSKSDGRPVDVQRPIDPNYSGRFHLTTQDGWTADAVRTNGNWHLTNVTRSQSAGMDMTRISALKQKLRSAQSKDLYSKLTARRDASKPHDAGKDIKKPRDRDRDHER